MSAARRKGTAWESAVVDLLRASGWPHAERRAMNGALDKGDVNLGPGVVIECKAHAAINLAAFMEEAKPWTTPASTAVRSDD